MVAAAYGDTNNNPGPVFISTNAASGKAAFFRLK